MAARREPIHELYEKIFGMMDLTGFTSNLQGFCDAAGISREGLKACLFDTGTRGLSSDYQRALAAFVRFRLDWPEWIEIDPVRIRNGQRRDAAEAFLARCRKEGRPKRGSKEPGEPVPLKEDMFADCEKAETPLASLSLRTGQSQNVPGEVSLGFDLNCPEDNACGQVTGVKRAFLVFGCGRTTDVKERTGYPAGETFNNARFTPHSVDASKPSWCVESADGGVIGLVGDVPPSFIRVFNLTPGSSVCAELKAFVKDIASAFVVPQDGKAQSAAKTKIKKRLQELKIPGGETGEGTLASAEIKFCARGG
jgi:hypothetical protein